MIFQNYRDGKGIINWIFNSLEAYVENLKRTQKSLIRDGIVIFSISQDMDTFKNKEMESSERLVESACGRILKIKGDREYIYLN